MNEDKDDIKIYESKGTLYSQYYVLIPKLNITYKLNCVNNIEIRYIVTHTISTYWYGLMKEIDILTFCNLIENVKLMDFNYSFILYEVFKHLNVHEDGI